MAVFTFNIPQVGQSLGSSRSQILNNFTNLADTIAVNHGGVNGPNNGKHLQVEMPRQNPTAPTNLANEGTLYTFLSAASGVNTDIFYKVDASPNEYQLTRIVDSVFNRFGDAPRGWTFLPGALLLNYGIHNGGLNGVSGTETFAAPYSTVTGPFVIMCQPFGTSASLPTNGVTIVTETDLTTTTTFTWHSTATSSIYTGFWWMAIGF